MNRLIKINEQHYVICDDSEINEGDYYLTKTNDIVKCGNKNNFTPIGSKITHSTKRIEYGSVDSITGWIFDKIKPLLVSEIEELLYGYSVEKIVNKEYLLGTGNLGLKKAFIKGFNTHKELVKNTLFTVEDMKKAIQVFYYDDMLLTENNLNKVIQSLLPKTEWNVEFVDGKLKLM